MPVFSDERMNALFESKDEEKRVMHLLIEYLIMKRK